jgi:hypothetical protein
MAGAGEPAFGGADEPDEPAPDPEPMCGHGPEPFMCAGGRACDCALGVAAGVVPVVDEPELAACATTAVPPASAPVAATAIRAFLTRRGMALTSFLIRAHH